VDCQRRVDLTVAGPPMSRRSLAAAGPHSAAEQHAGLSPRQGSMKIVAASYGSQIQAEVMRESSAALCRPPSMRASAPGGRSRLEPQSGAGCGSDRVQRDVRGLSGDRPRDLSRASCIATPAASARRTSIRRSRSFGASGRSGQRWSAKAADGDRVTVDFGGTIDGQEFEGGEAKDFRSTWAKGGCCGLRAGSARIAPRPAVAIHGELSARYPASKAGGRTAQFALTVKRVEQIELPPVDAEFARALGIADGDLSRMRARTQSQCGARVASRLRARTREHVFDRLLEATRFRGAAGSGRRGTAAPREGRGGGRRRRPAPRCSRRRGIGCGSGADRRTGGTVRHCNRGRSSAQGGRVDRQSYENPPSKVITLVSGQPRAPGEIEAGLTEDNGGELGTGAREGERG